MSMPESTMNDDGLKKSLTVSAIFHVLVLLFIYFGLPHLMPPLPEHHDPVPFQIVEIADLTNTRVKDDEVKPQPPQPPPPPPQPEPPKPEVKPPPPPPTPEVPKPPEQQAEALKAAPVPKPKPPEPKPADQDFSKLLKNLENKKPDPKSAETKTDVKPVPQQDPKPVVPTQAPSLSQRLTITENDALRRQLEGCWNPPIGARDAQNLIVELAIDMNADRTPANVEIVDQSRYNTDTFFRAAADSAVRAVRSPKCSPFEVPPEKYNDWRRITITFDPRDLL